MNTQEKFEAAVEILRSAYGSHVRVAEHLGITPVHWRLIRNHHRPASKPLTNLVILKAEQVAKERPDA